MEHDSGGGRDLGQRRVGAPLYDPMAQRILRIRDVTAKTGLSRVTIWRMEREGRFPLRRQLSTNSVGWIAEEVDVWIATRAAGGRRG